MEKGTIGIVAVGVIAVWAFLSLTQTHDAERTVTRAKMDLDRAEFDRDFARLSGAPAEQQKLAEKRVEQAAAEYGKIKRDAEKTHEKERAKREELERATEEEIRRKGGPDLTAVAKQIEQNLDERR